MAIDRLRAYLMHKHLQAEQCTCEPSGGCGFIIACRGRTYQVPPANSSGGDGRPVRVERRGCSPREVSSSPHTCKRVNEKTNRGTRRSALLNCWLKTTL